MRTVHSIFLAILLSTHFLYCIPEEVLQGIRKHISTNSWGPIYYDVLPEVIKNHGYKTVVEVGVALGGHAEAILKNTEIDAYFGIDPYLYNYDPKDSFNSDVASYSHLSGQKNFDYLYEWVKDIRLQPFQERYRLIREPSVKASSFFADESIDCIFIDGDHRRPFVLQDLKAWFPKVREGGLIIGDDYWMESVASAVDEFFSSIHKKVFFFNAKSGYRLWAVYKSS